MKKICLILGITACLCATDTFAARDGDSDRHQTVGVRSRCPEGCHRVYIQEGGLVSIACNDERGHRCDDADIGRIQQTGNVESQSQKIDMDKAQSSVGPQSIRRAAKIMVPQKIIYREIAFDDSVDVNE